MSLSIKPALWLIIFIVGLPLLSETIYSPAMPRIAQAFAVEENLVELTLTIYLTGFAIGTLFWGFLSDRFGRKPCILMAFSLYLIGCVGCGMSPSINNLVLFRFIQGLGGSAGSVLGQAICREAFHGADRGRVFASVGSALSLSPALGPTLGGLITQNFDWPVVFAVLALLGLSVLTLVHFRLPETNVLIGKKDLKFLTVMRRLFSDQRILGFIILVGVINGIGFSYYAEGSFIMIDMLRLTPAQFGYTFILLALSGVASGLTGRRLLTRYTTQTILEWGLAILLGASALLVGSVLFVSMIQGSNFWLILSILVSMTTMMFGTSWVMISSLSSALEDYQQVIGTASALFGFSYYSFISLVTFIMAELHDDTIYPMPMFFFALALLGTVAYRFLIRPSLVAHLS
ncbi:MAG: multidrug effflux MFS transporter [Candidatus Paracaedibacteraceae bacterium]|nr:multidrug effflux MFS transporter [Candidatus Paracaedibacteraceae bacterium]